MKTNKQKKCNNFFFFFCDCWLWDCCSCQAVLFSLLFIFFSLILHFVTHTTVAQSMNGATGAHLGPHDSFCVRLYGIGNSRLQNFPCLVCVSGRSGWALPTLVTNRSWCSCGWVQSRVRILSLWAKEENSAVHTDLQDLQGDFQFPFEMCFPKSILCSPPSNLCPIRLCFSEFCWIRSHKKRGCSCCCRSCRCCWVGGGGGSFSPAGEVAFTSKLEE